ncbi:hypothetical protein [Chitinophaga cymbidii]|uniref:YD repeat-containing protein n=1 Tax=Chitinophaga cymbidii TaxID=1096750 RepID=A0A512RP95_9BACT|nr:hypothetical protein [Chitinophaga cymbidii]GEP97523.1 hypothetical protein CCY01nite_37830 [Chitinophaga cymbidii]
MKLFPFLLLILLCLQEIPKAQTVSPGDVVKGLADQKGGANVSFSTGIMHYSIPLFQASQDEYSLPVALTYSAGGVKVNQTPGLAGLGWGLNFGGGIITRTMKGASADEDQNIGYLNHPAPTSYPAYEEYKRNINANKIDGESDIFQLEMNGYSVKFILVKKDNNVEVEPLIKTDVSITCQFDGPSISGWIVKDPLGNIYEFIASHPGNTFIKNLTPTNSFSENIITSWHLKSVELMNDGKIDYTYYEEHYAEAFNSYSSTYSFYGVPLVLPILGSDPGLNSALASLQASSQNNIQNLELLTDNLRKLTANRDKTLRALSPNSMDYVFPSVNMLNQMDLLSYNERIQQQQYEIQHVNWELENILNNVLSIIGQMYSNDHTIQSEITEAGQHNILFNKLIKKISLRNSIIEFKYIPLINSKEIYTYDRILFRSINGEVIKFVQFDYSRKGYLKKVQVVAADKTVEREYKFDYYDEDEDLHMYAQDYWGYYNGKSNNTTLLMDDPRYIVSGSGGILPVFGNVNVPGDYLDKVTNTYGAAADRRPDSSMAKARSLKQVTTLMGSKTNFEYEGNTVYLGAFPDPVHTGGLRIKKITHDPGFGTPMVKEYKYDFPATGDPTKHLSSGRLVDLLKRNFIYQYSYSPTSPPDVMVSTDPIDFGNLDISNSNNGVLYHYVEEISNDKSCIGYKYAAIPPVNTSASHKSLFDDALLAKIFYDSSGKIVYIERYSYLTNQDLDSRDEDLNLVSYDYFQPYTSAVYSELTQTSKEPVFYEANSLALQFPDVNSYHLSFGDYNFWLNPYSRIFLPNYAPRCKTFFSTFDYTIPFKQVLLLKEKQEFYFGDYDTAIAYASSNVPGLPDEKAYLFERLLAAPNIPVNKTETKFSYENPAHLMPTKIQSINSKGHLSTVRTKYAADYQLPQNEIISRMQMYHIKSAIIEKQGWVSRDQGITYEFLNGERFDYAEAINNGKSGFLQNKQRILQKSTSFNPSIYGFSENLSTILPYTSIAWDNNTLYQAENTLKWKQYADFMRPTAIVDRAGRITDVKIYDNFRGTLLLESNYIDPDNATAIDFSSYQVHPYYNNYNLFKKASPALTEYPYISFFEKPFFNFIPIDLFKMDHMRYISEVISQLDSFHDGYPSIWQSLYNDIEMFRALTGFFYKVEDRVSTNEFSQAIYNLRKAMEQITPQEMATLSNYDISGYNFYYHEMWIYVSELTNSLFTDGSMANYQNYEDVILAEKNPVIPTDESGSARIKVNVNNLVTSGKHLDVYLVNNPETSLYGKLYYNNGSTSGDSFLATPTNVSDKVKKATINLSGLPSGSQLKEIEFKLSSFEGSFVALPSNSIFKAYSYLPDGNPFIVYDQTGDYTSIFYNQLGQPSYTKDQRGNVLSVDSVSLANNVIYSSTVQVEIRNNYDLLSPSPVNIELIELIDSFTGRLVEMEVLITPGQIYRTEIPTGTYRLYMRTSNPVSQIMFNNSVYTPGVSSAVTLTSGMNNVTISVNP